MVFKKGRIPWNKGKNYKMSEEIKRKISKANKGKSKKNRDYVCKRCPTCREYFEKPRWRNAKFCSNECVKLKANSGSFKKEHKESEEIRKKRSNSLKGHSMYKNKERNLKISKSKLGKPNPNVKNNPQIFKKGCKSWNYIDGRSKNASPARYGDDWAKIRLLIYKRDNYTCQECGIGMTECNEKFNMPLHIHHKIPFLQSFDNSLNNLIALCPSCHRKIDAQIIKQTRRLKKCNI